MLPLGHLAFQIADLMAVVAGAGLPVLDKVEDMMRHFFHHEGRA
jgi:hypothetical protein